jgi:hypothetical protein
MNLGRTVFSQLVDFRPVGHTRYKPGQHPIRVIYEAGVCLRHSRKLSAKAETVASAVLKSGTSP